MEFVRALGARHYRIVVSLLSWTLVLWTLSALTPARSAAALKFFPVPIYSTSPEAGSVYGAMPVVMMIDRANRTYSMFAPSVTYNKTVGLTGTMRWFYYPDDYTTYSFQPSYSEYTNRKLSIGYSSLPRKTLWRTTEWELLGRRDIFYRFFGLGPLTKDSAETGYTRVQASTSLREGINLAPFLNVGLLVGADRHLAQDIAPASKASAMTVFAGTPGMGGATTVHGGASLRIDTRENFRHSRQGLASEFTGSAYRGFANTPSFYKLENETSVLIPTSERFQTATRFYWGRTMGTNVPFQDQISLGGDNRLRGFMRDRFVGKNAWLYDIEERITLFYTRIAGVITDWQFTPFIGVGQVYEGDEDMWKYRRVAGGFGMRAFCRPNMVGRFDFAWGGAASGLAIYIELGYPF